MSELLRNFIGRMRAVVANRRRSPRKRLRLVCRVSIHDPGRAADAARRAPALEAHTRDISVTGFALVAPAIRIGDRYLTNSTLRIVLEDPAGDMSMLATSVRYEQLSADGEETGFLLGIRIIEISDEDRARFEAHLRSFE